MRRVDTGFNDRSPGARFDPYTAAPALHGSEEEWLRHKLRTFGGRTILLSHHPLFSAHRRLIGTRSRPRLCLEHSGPVAGG